MAQCRVERDDKSGLLLGHAFVFRWLGNSAGTVNSAWAQFTVPPFSESCCSVKTSIYPPARIAATQVKAEETVMGSSFAILANGSICRQT